MKEHLLILLVTVCKVISLCTDGSDGWEADLTDCTAFYICSSSVRVKYVCPSNTVADIENRVCVQKGSASDTCSNKNTGIPVTDPIVRQTTPAQFLLSTTTKPCLKPGLFPVSQNCAQFIKCSTDLIATLEECSYPHLFNTENQRCQLPGLVKCGTRYEPMDPCEYRENKCTYSHCIPCTIRFPSCRGLPDGLNPWTGRENSPYFAVCRFQRVVFQGKCSYEEHSEEQIFDSKLRVCVKAV